MVRYREHSRSPFFLHRAAVCLHKIHDIKVCESIDGTVEELSVGDHISEQVLRITAVRQIAASFSRDIDLFSKLLIFLINGDIMSALRGADGSSHSRCPTAYNHYFAHLFLFFSTSFIFFSMASATVSRTLIRAYHLEFPSTTIQGASFVEVFSSISFTAST